MGFQFRVCRRFGCHPRATQTCQILGLVVCASEGGGAIWFVWAVGFLWGCARGTRGWGWGFVEGNACVRPWCVGLSRIFWVVASELVTPVV